MHSKIKVSVARLLNVNAADITLQKVDSGLSHQGFICLVSGQRYFIKVYRLAGNAAFAVTNINRLTSYMCSRGVPASRVIRWSPDLPNIVVHEFVEGEIASGDIRQLAAITQLYSQVALIGAENGKHLSKAEYLSAINSTINTIKNIEGTGTKTDGSIHAGMLKLADKVLKSLQAQIPEQKLFHIHMHDDFTEKNILTEGDQVKLLCDWDSYRLKFLNEHIACTACRFSTDPPLQGVLRADKLTCFLQSLDPEVLSHVSNVEEYALLFPLLATLKHLRTYAFRNSLVQNGRPDLKTPLLAWPLEHCDWLFENQRQVSDWVREALLAADAGSTSRA